MTCNATSRFHPLTLALNRWEGSKVLSRITIVKEVGDVLVPGTPFAPPEAELVKLAGFWKDAEASRKEARRLLREAGVPEGYNFTLLNRAIPEPYEPVGIWLLNQWRKVALNVQQKSQETSPWYQDLRGGTFDVSIDFQCGVIVEPDLDLYKFQSGPTAADPKSVSDANYGRYTDPILDELYVKQSRATDPEERKKYVRALERQLLEEQAHQCITLGYHRIVPHHARVKGWKITPSHDLNTQLDTVWLAE